MNLFKRIFPRSLADAASTGNLSALQKRLMQRVSKGEVDAAFLLAVKARSLAAAKLLQKNGANVSARDHEGNTALHYACEWPDPQYEVVKWLIEKHADVNASNNDGMTPETGNTPLSKAVSAYDNILAVALIRAGANVNAPTPSGAPLHIACRSGFKHTEDIFRRYSGNVVSTLLQNGADPNIQEQFEAKTPLHVAAQFEGSSSVVEERYLAIVHSLLTAGADTNLRDNKGRTACDYALERKHQSLAAALGMRTQSSGSPTHKAKSLDEKAADAPIIFRILVDVIQINLEREHPQVLLLPHWSSFEMAATVAGCVTLALRLHFEVEEDQRTPLELKMREVLQKRFPESEAAYEDSFKFVTESIGEIPRSERGKYIFPLIALWVVRSLSDGKTIQEEEWITGKLSELYQNETVGFWKSA